MRVSKNTGYLVLAVMLGVMLVIGPVAAGEHPWSEDPLKKSKDTTGVQETVASGTSGGGTGVTGNEDGSEYESLSLGTPLFWVDLLMEAIGKGNEVLSSSGPQSVSPRR